MTGMIGVFTSKKILLGCALILCVISFGHAQSAQATVVAKQDYVGSAQCESCHQQETSDWLGSHHEMAMRHASAESVRGKFDNQVLMFRGAEHRFYQKNEKYWLSVKEQNGVGQLSRYEIKYTFGVEPLQQYMVEFDDGRVQLLPFAWDSRSAAQGGQRWFDLYPEQSQPHQLFYWKNVGQNWNFMCADCHSTNVKKNFDVNTNRYATTYSEISVGCEACHGPGKAHVVWAESNNQSNNQSNNKNNSQSNKKSNTQGNITPDSDAYPYKGFNRNLAKPSAQWHFTEGAKIASPKERRSSDQVIVCAQCHSRRTQISDAEDSHPSVMGDRYRLNLIEDQHYYPDGQIYDENYVVGSFLQSKMHTQGVACSNCHNPHSTELVAPKESICLQCHKADAYDTPAHHHHHTVGGEGSACVDCHMPPTTYMQIDERRDHRFHIPNPTIAGKTESPDTCLKCHQNKDSQWSAKTLQSWGVKQSISEIDFAPVFRAAREGYIEAEGPLSHIAQNEAHADIIRAAALERLEPFNATNTLIAVARGAKSENEFIRVGAINGAANIPLKERWRILAPLLADNVLLVRTEAAKVLMPLWGELTAAQKTQLQPALDEYMRIQSFNADRGAAHTNRGNMLMYQGLMAEAEAAYQLAMRIEPYFDNSAINLADLYRLQNKNEAGIATLTQAAELNPDSGAIAYSLGLAFIRQQQTEQAQLWLKRATDLTPDNGRYWYVYALAAESDSATKAQLAMAQAYKVSDSPQYLYGLCEMYIRHQSPTAGQCLDQLKRVAPPEAVEQLQNQIRSATKPHN